MTAGVEHLAGGADDALPAGLFAGNVPAPFVTREVAFAAGSMRPYDPAEWRGALVLVKAGSVELEQLDGTRWVFDTGAALWLEGLPLRAIRCPDTSPAVLVVVRRA